MTKCKQKETYGNDCPASILIKESRVRGGWLSAAAPQECVGMDELMVTMAVEAKQMEKRPTICLTCLSKKQLFVSKRSQCLHTLSVLHRAREDINARERAEAEFKRQRTSR